MPSRAETHHAEAVLSEGCRRPRAQGGTSDAGVLDLRGDWAFRLAPTAAGTGRDLATLTEAPDGWGTVRVPGHWVLQGHGDPLYTNTAYPFPIDPPRLPDENPTGDHLRVFTLPDGWRLPGTVLRFQGVDSAATVWLNGTELGHWSGSRLPAELEVGDLLTRGRNVLAVRVHRWSAGSYLEDQDMWWLPGIFRDVELLERPAGAADDVRIRADYDHRTGAGRLLVETLDAAGEPMEAWFTCTELGLARQPTGAAVTVPAVEPWSAEQPRLYRVEVGTGAERTVWPVGFRTVFIEETPDGGRLLVNGRPVRMRGVNRHEHHPDTGRTLTVEQMRADLLLMKQHNVNALRTSHYPPHPALLTLCDELGLWVVEENDLETHGFIYAGWQGNPVDDDAWTPAVLDRTARMVERDKNHPSVVVWSLGNESEGGRGITAAEEWIRAADPTRPIHYERDRTYASSDFYSLMYPSLELTAAICDRTEPTPDALADDPEGERRRRRLPFLLCEYAHAMGNGPGSLADYEQLLSASDRVAGAFVWEWVDHGIRRTAADGTRFLAHGGDIDHQPNGGRYCLDGLVTADRVPSPGLVELAAVIAPIGVEVACRGRAADRSTPSAPGRVEVVVQNRYDVLDTEHVSFRWALEREGDEVAAGALSVPEVPARGRTTVQLELPPELQPEHDSPAGELWLTVTAELRTDTAWARSGHRLGAGQCRVDPAADARRDRDPASPRTHTRPAGPRRTGAGGFVLGADEFTADGTPRSLAGVPVTWSGLQVWRAPIENDHGQGSLNDTVSLWRAVGLDRMLERVDEVIGHPDGLEVRTRIAPATQPFGLLVRYRWTAQGDALALRTEVEPVGPWDSTPYGQHRVTLPTLGIGFALPARYGSVEWFGRGPGEAYPDSRTAALVGRYRSSVDALGFEYAFPQDSGRRDEVRWARFEPDDDGPALRIGGAQPWGLTARRCTAADLDRAGHPHEVPRREAVHLLADLAARGLGSASVGPALPGRYEVQPVERELELRFSPGTDAERQER